MDNKTIDERLLPRHLSIFFQLDVIHCHISYDEDGYIQHTITYREENMHHGIVLSVNQHVEIALRDAYKVSIDAEWMDPHRHHFKVDADDKKTTTKTDEERF